MDRPKCKLCSRTFANGRALGGHMKAHLATLPLPPKPLSSASASFSSSSSHPPPSDDDKAAAIYRLRENPRRSLKFSDPEFSSPDEEDAPVGHDGEESEAEAESTRKRGRRQLSLAAGEDEEAAIAMCLVMLSRDKWRTTASAKNNADVKRHRCEVCNKSFRSSQALGGHRVTHRKAMNHVKEEAATATDKYRRRFVVEEEKIFECPYCFKVFSSGQALGGHKRSHVIGSGSVSSSNNSKPHPSHKQSSSSSLIDLNLPAQPEEEDDRSVVSDAEPLT